MGDLQIHSSASLKCGEYVSDVDLGCTCDTIENGNLARSARQTLYDQYVTDHKERNLFPNRANPSFLGFDKNHIL